MVRAVIDALGETGCEFFLVHEAGAHALGLDYSLFLRVVDVCLTKGNLRVDEVVTHSCYTEGRIRDLPVRIWSRVALGLARPTRVVRSPLYGCDVLAPDLLLERLDLSPDAAMLAETRALLATVVYVDTLTDEQLSDVLRYVRGL